MPPRGASSTYIRITSPCGFNNSQLGHANVIVGFSVPSFEKPQYRVAQKANPSSVGKQGGTNCDLRQETTHYTSRRAPH